MVVVEGLCGGVGVQWGGRIQVGLLEGFIGWGEVETCLVGAQTSASVFKVILPALWCVQVTRDAWVSWGGMDSNYK